MTTEGTISSHGRGGAGNIGLDTTEYVDGEIVRSASTDPSAATGPVSTGRGGTGNITHSPSLKPTEPTEPTTPATTTTVPTAALRPSMEDENYHVGRGGKGNVHHGVPDKPEGATSRPQGLVNKVKDLFHKDK